MDYPCCRPLPVCRYTQGMSTKNIRRTRLFAAGLCACVIAFLLAAPITGQPRSHDQPRVRYEVSLRAPETQTVDIALHLTDLNPRDDSLVVHLPTWRPGKYLILDPAGTMRSISAFDGDGELLSMRKVRKQSWEIETNGADAVRIDYTLYANSLGDRTRHVDDTHAFLSGSCVFLYSDVMRDEPCIVEIDAPDGWGVATGLEAVGNDPYTRIAPSYDVLMDSPIEVGIHERIDFEAAGKPHEIVLWGDYDQIDRERMIDDFTAIIEDQLDVFGELPYERYVFLTHVDRGGGGGTEHINSTIMQTRSSSIEGSVNNDRSYQRFLGLVSHEFFHTWNVKAFRPAGMHRYDFERENYSRLFWIVEGTTSYYDDLTLARTGIIGEKRYLGMIASSHGSIADRPGAAVQSLEESSFDAWIKFNKSTPDSVNTTVSFYSKGALVSLMLDMEIRRRSNNEHSMDDLMRLLYERYPITADRGYSPDDVIAIAEELAGSDLTSFFDANVAGTAPLAMADALSAAGLELTFDEARRDDDDSHPALQPFLGLSLSGNTVRSLRTDSPAYAAGFMAGDEIIAINGERLRGSIDAAISEYEPHESIVITFFRRDELQAKSITLGAKPDGTWKIDYVDEPTELQRTIYESWIKQPWPGTEEVADDADTTDAP